jgi:phage FluMu gp28-like protein
VADTPLVLLPYQIRWVSDKSRVKVAEKSRRIGITWAQASDDVLTAGAASGMDVWYVGYNQDMAREYIETAGEWGRVFNLAASGAEEVLIEDEDKDILAYRVRFSSGNKITALSSRPSNLRGKQGRVVIDEAAFHPDLKGLLKSALALLMWGGQVVVISTHDGEDNYFNELIQDVRAGKKPYSLHRTTIDDALSEGLYKRICLRLGRDWSLEAEKIWRENLIAEYGDDADEELFCVPASGEGAFLTRALIEACMDGSIPVFRWVCNSGFVHLPDGKREYEARQWLRETVDPILDDLPASAHFLGEDFGRDGDLTVLTPLGEEPGLVYRAPFMVELRNVPFRQQEQILFHVCDHLPNFSGAALDARGNGQFLAEVAMQRYGAHRVRQVMLSESWYREQMPKYKSAFEDRTIVLPRDADILADHRAIKMNRGVAKVPDNARTKGADGHMRHGDSAVSGALGFYAAMTIERYVPLDIQSAGARETATMFEGYR